MNCSKQILPSLLVLGNDSHFVCYSAKSYTVCLELKISSAIHNHCGIQLLRGIVVLE